MEEGRRGINEPAYFHGNKSLRRVCVTFEMREGYDE